MGEIAEAMLDGDMDCVSGEWLGDGQGYPRTTIRRESYLKLQGPLPDPTCSFCGIVIKYRERGRCKNTMNCKRRVAEKAARTQGAPMPMTPTDINAAGLPWDERVTTFIVNPESAKLRDIIEMASTLQAVTAQRDQLLAARPALPDGGLEAATKLLLLYAELRHAPREEFNHDEHRERLRKLGWNGKEATSRFIESLRREAIKVGRAALQKQGE
jgi:hypothetical protein